MTHKTESDDEIEVTPEMIRAGTDILALYDPSEDSVEGWAEDIYREMESVRRSSDPERSHADSSHKSDTS